MHASFFIIGHSFNSQFQSPKMHNTRYNRNQVQNSSKIIGLHGRKTRWLDDKAKELKRHAIKLQRLAAIDALKSVGNLERNSSTEKKNWCKKKKYDVFADNVGTFQKALSRSLSSFKDSFCLVDNLSATCWFNAYVKQTWQSPISACLKGKIDNMKEYTLRGLCNTVENLGRKH